MTDISKEAVDALSARLRGQDAIPNRTEVADHVDALRAALDEAEARAVKAEAERDAANALIAELVEALKPHVDVEAKYRKPYEHPLSVFDRATAHLGAKP